MSDNLRESEYPAGRLLKPWGQYAAGEVLRFEPKQFARLLKAGMVEAIVVAAAKVRTPKFKPKRKPGEAGNSRPILTEDTFRLLDKLARKGLTDAEMADALGISPVTISDWRKKFPEVDLDLKEAKEAADRNVENALYKRACGFSHPDTHVSVCNGVVTLTAITKTYPPDATSCIFWLKNRQPHNWRDRQELTGKDGEPVAASKLDLDKLTVPELIQLKGMLDKAKAGAAGGAV